MTTTLQEFAARITGREYPFHLTPDERREAKAAGLVVVFGASDDLMEFEGALHDETGAYDGRAVLVSTEGALPSWDNVEYGEAAAQRYFNLKRHAKPITPVWSPKGADEGLSWIYKTDIPHATFEVVEDGEVYCRGIVFHVASVAGRLTRTKPSCAPASARAGATLPSWRRSAHVWRAEC